MTSISIYKNLNYNELINKLYELKLNLAIEKKNIPEKKVNESIDNLKKELNELQEYLKKEYENNYTMLINLADNKVNTYLKNNEYTKISDDLDNFFKSSKKTVSEKINPDDFSIKTSFDISDYKDMHTKKQDFKKDRKELEEIEKEIKDTLKDLKNKKTID